MGAGLLLKETFKQHPPFPLCSKLQARARRQIFLQFFRSWRIARSSTRDINIEYWGEGRRCCLIDSVNRLSRCHVLFFYTRQLLSWGSEFLQFPLQHITWQTWQVNQTDVQHQVWQAYPVWTSLAVARLWRLLNLKEILPHRSLPGTVRPAAVSPMSSPGIRTATSNSHWNPLLNIWDHHALPSLGSRSSPSKQLERAAWGSCTKYVKLLKLPKADRKTCLRFT